jgi:hypothetical protein
MSLAPPLQEPVGIGYCIVDLSGYEDQGNLYSARSEFMSNRVLNRRGARELTPEESKRVSGASSECFFTVSGMPPRGDDVHCVPD